MMFWFSRRVEDWFLMDDEIATRVSWYSGREDVGVLQFNHGRGFVASTKEADDQDCVLLKWCSLPVMWFRSWVCILNQHLQVTFSTMRYVPPVVHVSNLSFHHIGKPKTDPVVFAGFALRIWLLGPLWASLTRLWLVGAALCIWLLLVSVT